MNVAVTGGLGFIGSHLVNNLIAQGHVVLTIDNLSTGKKEKDNPRASLLIGDIRDTEWLCNALQGSTIVFHTAALPRVPLSIEKPLETHDNNVNGTLSVLVASNKVGVKRVIYSASSSAYGAQATLPLKETMKPNPMNPYAAQKLMGEIYCKVFSQVYGLETVALRYFNVYGAGMDFDGAYASVISKFIKQHKAQTPLTVAGDGLQTRDFTHIKDIIRANLAAMESTMVGSGEVINIGAGENHSVNEVAKLIGGETEKIVGRKNEARDTLADIALAKALLNWQPTVKFVDGLKELKDYYVGLA